MKIKAQMARVTGGAIDSCYYLAHRYDEAQGLVPEGMDSWVVGAGPGGHEVSTARPGWMNGLWWSPSGALYASFEPGKVYMRQPDSGEWLSALVGESLAGIWGLDDNHVYAWGKMRGRPTMHHWDGSEWNTVEAPGEILAMHGVSADRIVAVGAHGMCAFWDGESWAEQKLDTDAAFWGVAVAPDGRIWTAGPRAPICRHSLDEWEVVATSPVPILDVAFWNDAVWLAAGDFGLFGLRENGVVQLDKEVPALRLEARGNLIALAEDALLDTADGESFRRVSLRDFRTLVTDKPPGWDIVVEEPDIQDDDDPDFAGDFDDDEDDDD